MPKKISATFLKKGLINGDYFAYPQISKMVINYFFDFHYRGNERYDSSLSFRGYSSDCSLYFRNCFTLIVILLFRKGDWLFRLTILIPLLAYLVFKVWNAICFFTEVD